MQRLSAHSTELTILALPRSYQQNAATNKKKKIRKRLKSLKTGCLMLILEEISRSKRKPSKEDIGEDSDDDDNDHDDDDDDDK